MGIFGSLRRGWSRRAATGGRRPEHAGGTVHTSSRPGTPDGTLPDLAEAVAAERLRGRVTATSGADVTPGEVRPITRARIGAWCLDAGYHYFVDNDGDLGGLWRNRLFYFFLFGEAEEILQIRGQWNRQATIDRLEEVLDVCNAWNEEKVWPKAYVRVRDDGAVQVMCEVATDLEHGVDDAQLAVLLRCGLETGNLFLDSLDALYPDPAEARP